MSWDEDRNSALNSAMQLLQSGNPLNSEALCRKILIKEPSNSDALHFLALSLRAQGDSEQAEKIIRKALAQSRNNVSIFNNYGLILLDLGKFKEASKKLKKALRIDDKSVAAHTNLGHALKNLKKFDLAKVHYLKALDLMPSQVDALVNLAILCQEMGRLSEVQGPVSLALKNGVVDPGLDLVQGLIALEENRNVDAEHHFRAGLKLLPQSVPLIGNLGLALARQGHKKEALKLYHAALDIEPRNADIHLNLADAEKYDAPSEARAHIEKALAEQPSNGRAIDMFGFTLFMEGRFEEAISSFEKAYEYSPNFSQAVFHKAAALFLLGDLASAWALYNQKYGRSGIDGSPIGSAIPLTHLHSSRTERCLTWTDQGPGDEILQLGMIADLKEKSPPLTIATSERLVPLVTRSFQNAVCMSWEEVRVKKTETLGIDSQFPAYALGPSTRASMSDFPSRTAYLTACSEKVSELREKYNAIGNGRKLIGLSWKSTNTEFGPQKSLSLQDYKFILEDKYFCFVCLQYGDTDAEIESLPSEIRSRFIVDSEVDPLVDLDTFAAQIAATDLVISTSNTTVHFAGALGIPTWTLVPRIGPGWLWYWFDGREDSPWYPSMRLYRQNKSGDWGPAFEGIQRELRRFREDPKELQRINWS